MIITSDHIKIKDSIGKGSEIKVKIKDESEIIFMNKILIVDREVLLFSENYL